MAVSFKMVQKKNALKNGKFPIYLRITINRKSKFYSMPYSCKLKEWNDKKGEFSVKHPNYITFNKSLRDVLNDVTEIMQEITQRYKRVSLVRFDNYYNSFYNSEFGFIEFLDTEIKRMQKNKQIAYAQSFEQTKSRLKSFKPNIKDYQFEDIDYTFLSNFETFLRNDGANDSGIAVYMRNIRAIYNKAIKSKVVSRNSYPFEDFKISKFKRVKRKRALESYDMDKLIAFDTSEFPQGKNALYAYLFSYFARGMNFTDMAKLKWSEIRNSRFEYSRRKTGVHMSVVLPNIPKMNEILEFYKVYRLYETDYVFPILQKDELDYKPTEIAIRQKYVRQYYNKQLKQIAQKLNLSNDIDFYSARHSFATKALRANLSLFKIKQSLGHQNISTTEIYVQDFADDELNRDIN